MSRNQVYRLSGELELQALQQRIGYRGNDVRPSEQAAYGRRGEMIDTRPYERDIKTSVLSELLAHRRVAFAWRANSGKFKLADLYGERWIVVNFKGCADLLFMLVGGRFGACEVKRDGQKLRTEQQAFLDSVNTNGGLGFVARSAADVRAALR